MVKYDYTGKKVYMGIDVHKKTYACVSVCDGMIVKKDTMPAIPALLVAYIHNNFSGSDIETAYEAGFCGFSLHRELIQSGIKNIVVHPGSIEIASRDRVKTDKRDAKKIAEQLATHRLRGIYVPTLEQEGKRSVTRLRDSIVKSRHKVGQKFKALLFTLGLIHCEDDTIISKKWLKNKMLEVQHSGLPASFIYTLEHYEQQWLYFTQQLNTLKKDLLKMQSGEEQQLVDIYKSAPGIGDISALKIKDELGDMNQFSNEKQLFSYIGFTPTEYSSGEHVRQGHISRQGRAVLRHIFVESAWIAIRKDQQLRSIYLQIARTRGGRRAIIGVARRLAGRLRSCARKGDFYEIKKQPEMIQDQPAVAA